MRLAILFSFFLAFAVASQASNIQVSGVVSGTWDVDTVLVIDNLVIPNNQMLTINPGVKVIFNGYFLFKVEGQIFANGLVNDSISFFVTDTIGLYNLEIQKGSWAGFWFEPLVSNNDSSSFEFCNFKYGKAVSADTMYWHGGAVSIWKYSHLRFSNCSFSHNMAHKNGGAIYCKASDIKIENCDFIGNSGGTPLDYGYGGAVCLEYSNAKVYHNYFTQNSSSGVGGGLSFEYSNPDIEANYFYDNYSALGGGLCCLRSEEGNSVVNNLFENNESTFFGGGIAFLGAHTLFVNNTVINNFSAYGGGLYFNAAAMPKIKNCIIWNNMALGIDGHQVYIWDVYSAPEFYFNDIERGFEDFSGSGAGNFTGAYENNMDLDPQFVGMGDSPFSLAENSPCINSGTPDTLGLLLPLKDLAGNTRLKEEQIDMGCYESQGNSGLQHFSMDDHDMYVSPNPINNQATFYLNTTKFSSHAKLIIYNSKGSPVKTFDIENQSTINWSGVDENGNILPSGIYLYQIFDDQSVYTKKLVIRH